MVRFICNGLRIQIWNLMILNLKYLVNNDLNCFKIKSNKDIIKSKFKSF